MKVKSRSIFSSLFPPFPLFPFSFPSLCFPFLPFPSLPFLTPQLNDSLLLFSFDVWQFLGIGKHYQLSARERTWIRSYLTLNGVETDLERIPDNCLIFQRLFFHSEIHSEEYSRVRTSSSHHVGLIYDMGNQETKIYYATIHKFFKITIDNRVWRLALVSTYPFYRGITSHLPVIDTRNPHKTGRIVEVEIIDRIVILEFTPPQDWREGNRCLNKFQ